MPEWWAVIGADEPVGSLPYVVTRWRCYARYVAWAMTTPEDEDGPLAVVPWESPQDHPPR